MAFVKYTADIYLRWVSRRTVRVRWAGGGGVHTDSEAAGSRSRDKTRDNTVVFCTRLSLAVYSYSSLLSMQGYASRNDIDKRLKYLLIT